jgi:signal transduction histidine kinase
MILRYRLDGSVDRPAIHVVKNYADLPEIECCPGQLNQVFMNLLSNAIDACEESNRDRNYADIEESLNQIKITTALVDSSVVTIAVSDNGVGIPTEAKNKLFDPFFTTKPVGQGTGLGLAISHEIITKQHNGTIEIDSELGQGTTFTIRLPIRPLCDLSRSPTLKSRG